ncbi:MAG: hypothetical protein KTR24_18125 [Saprospiraceae bacterium]|nr:hypothetical protein [Saprospiraceae bacterium]
MRRRDLCDMDGNAMRSTIIALILAVSCHLHAQRSLDVVHFEDLVVQRSLDFEDLNYVKESRREGELKLLAHRDFKFVQIRNTATYVLVPASYSARSIDIKALTRGVPGIAYRIDPKGSTYRICGMSKLSKDKTKPRRCGKTCLHFGKAAGTVWQSAGLLQDEAILVPPYIKV